ncbi:MAG: class I SAM-dependent methyltransferase [Gemmataceae bacterium]
MRKAIREVACLLRQQSSRLMEAALHHLTGRTLNEGLPTSGCQVAIEPLVPRLDVCRRSLFRTSVRVRNEGNCTWSSYGTQPVLLHARWESTNGQRLAMPGTLLPLPRAVRPGDEVVVRGVVRALPSLGTYRLVFDLRQGTDRVFARQGAGDCAQDVFVDAPPTEDMDYHKFFASFDLDRDHWTVVGPTTREEFEQLGQIKLRHMIDLGLTPDARVLDIGCGTGQLARPLEGYLSDRGGYLGLELIQAGVDFCRKRFRRPNFRFDRNEMTRLPVQGETFDMIVFFSVFTHTYPQETAALLREARRCLAPSGVIFADFFTSPMVEDFAGNRAALEVSEVTLRRIFDDCSLRAAEVFNSPWQEFGARRFYRLVSP